MAKSLIKIRLIVIYFEIIKKEIKLKIANPIVYK